jgi:hypothetical protein
MSSNSKIIAAFFLLHFFFVDHAFAAKIDTQVYRCRADNFCDALAKALPGDSAKDIADRDSCFRKKLHGCYSATTRGGVWWRGNDVDLSQLNLYGNFCGWRNLSKNLDGSKLDWKNDEEVLAATKRFPAIDSLDEICKWHDIQYFTPPFAICEADKIFIDRIEALVWDPKTPLSNNAREVAMALSGAIWKNKNTCKVISWMKRKHLWN